MKKVIESVAFVLLKDKKILVEKRALTKRVDPGKIAIPSGGVEKGETNKQAMLREVKEELDIVPTKFEFLETIFYPHKEVDFNIHYFLVNDWKGEIKTIEAEDLLWVNLDETKVDENCDKKAIRLIINNLLA